MRDEDFNAALAYIHRIEAAHNRRIAIMATVCAGSVAINIMLVVLAWVLP